MTPSATTGPDTPSLPPSHPVYSAENPTLGEVVARVAAEVAMPLTQALDRVIALAATGSIDGDGLRALRDEIDGARRAGLRGQQIARFIVGQAHPGVERVALDEVLRAVLIEQAAGAQPGAVGHRPQLAAVPVMGDASLIHTLLRATADWCVAQSASAVDWLLDRKPWPVRGRLRCRFQPRRTDAALAAPDPDAPAAATADERTEVQPNTPTNTPLNTPPSTPVSTQSSTPTGTEPDTAAETLDWLLMQYAAHVAGVLVLRETDARHCQLTLEFPHAVDDQAEGTEAAQGTGAGGRGGALMAGSQVLVLAGRRELRQLVREALRGHDLFIDYAPSVAAARDYCAEGLPQVLIYEAGFDGHALDGLRRQLAEQAPALAQIEITPSGQDYEIAPDRARVGADGLAQTLAAVLVMELSRRR